MINGYDVHTEILTNIVNYGPNDEVIRLLYDAFGPTKLIWGSEFAALQPRRAPVHPGTLRRSASTTCGGAAIT